MNKENIIKLTIEDTAIGEIYMEVPYTPNNKFESDNSKFVISIPKKNFFEKEYTHLDLSLVVEYDIKNFENLNKNSDENHQIYIDTLCIYGINISNNHIRIQYWFNQDGNKEIHRMCAGVLTHCDIKPKYNHKEDLVIVFPECYSPDVCVYW